MDKKISIVMPSFNQASYIERSIKSILNQSYKNFELIIVDGGSTDGTIDIIKKYKDHIAVWVSEKDNGQSDALNKGFKLATGEIFGWLNSDDIYLPEAFSLAVDAFQKYPSKKIVYGDWYTIDENETILAHEYAFPISLGHTIYEGVSINAQAMFWKREVHEIFSEFDSKLHYTMDYQMVLCFIIQQKSISFFQIPFVLGAFRRYSGQKTGNSNQSIQITEHRYLANIYGYNDKYTFMGKIKRFYYRFRRLYWYFRRGSFVYSFKKSLNSNEMSRVFKKVCQKG